MKNQQKKSDLYFILAIIIIAFILTVPFWIYGIPNTNDSVIHFTFASAVSDSIADGNIYVQGEPNVNNGYGGFALRFYPILTHYSLSIAHFITNDWFNAGFLFFWVWMSIGGIGVYFLAKEWFDSKIAFIAASLFVIEPYHNAQINSSFADAEFVAGCLMTFCLLFVTRVIKYGKTNDVLGLALFYGLLILTHIPIAMIGSFCLFVYAALYLVNSQNWKLSGLKLIAGIAVGISAGSYYLIRLITEIDWINHSSSQYLSEGGFSYKLFFVDIRGYFFPSDLVLFYLLILILPCVVIILLKSNKETTRQLIPIIVITLLSIFMSTSLSEKIWENVGILQKIQFPWRWLTIASIGYGIIIGASLVTLKSILGEKKLILSFWFCFCIFASSFFTYSYIIGANLLDADFFLLHGETFNNRVKRGSFAPHHEVWQTIWAKKTAFQIDEKVIANQRTCEIIKWKGFDKKFLLSAGQPTDARIAVSYYPHWKAKINGKEVNVSKTDDGAIVIPIPAEEALVELDFVEPFIVNFFIYLSAATLFAILISLFLMNLEIKKRKSTVLEE